MMQQARLSSFAKLCIALGCAASTLGVRALADEPMTESPVAVPTLVPRGPFLPLFSESLHPHADSAVVPLSLDPLRDTLLRRHEWPELDAPHVHPVSVKNTTETPLGRFNSSECQRS